MKINAVEEAKRNKALITHEDSLLWSFVKEGDHIVVNGQQYTIDKRNFNPETLTLTLECCPSVHEIPVTIKINARD